MMRDEDLHRQALQKILGEISEAMDAEDARRLRGELDASDNGRAENPINPANLAVDGAQSDAELEGGHAGNLSAEDVNDAEGGDLTTVDGGEGSDEQAIREAQAELARAASEPGGDTRPGLLGGESVPDVSTEQRGIANGENADNAGVMVKGDAGKGGEGAPGQESAEEYVSPWNRPNQSAATGIRGRRRRR
jgi:hypothetical protein